MAKPTTNTLKPKGIFQDLDYPALGFVLLSLRPVFIAFLGTASLLMGFNTQNIAITYYLLIWLLFVLGIKKNGIRPTKEGGIFFALVIIIGLLSIPFSFSQVLWNVNLESFITFNSISYFHSVLYIPLVFSIKDFSKLKEYFSFFARIFMLFVVVNDIFTINILNIKHEDDMMYSYGVVLFTCILINNFSKNKNKYDLLLSFLGVISALLSGTRGPLVCIVVCVFLSYFNKIKNRVSKFLFIIISAAFVFLGGAQSSMNGLLFLLTKLGFGDLRLIRYQEENMLMDDSGRSEIASKIWNAIIDNGVLGGGIGYDRRIEGVGAYSHNIALEFLCDFGLVLGPIFLIVIIISCYNFCNSKNKDMASIGVVLVSTVFIKLFFSSSFIIVYDFFLMLGLYYNNKKTSHLPDSFQC